MANNKLLNVVDRYFPSQSPQLNICTSTYSMRWVGLDLEETEWELRQVGMLYRHTREVDNNNDPVRGAIIVE